MVYFPLTQTFTGIIAHPKVYPPVHVDWIRDRPHQVFVQYLHISLTAVLKQGLHGAAMQCLRREGVEEPARVKCAVRREQDHGEDK